MLVLLFIKGNHVSKCQLCFILFSFPGNIVLSLSGELLADLC